MSPDKIAIVRRTVVSAINRTPDFSSRFLARLFYIDPDLRWSIPGSLSGQGRRMTEMLTIAVRQIDEPDLLGPTMSGFSRRFARAGFRMHHIPIVGLALLLTLELALGEDFDETVQAAWVEAYTTMAIHIVGDPDRLAA